MSVKDEVVPKLRCYLVYMCCCGSFVLTCNFGWFAHINFEWHWHRLRDGFFAQLLSLEIVPEEVESA